MSIKCFPMVVGLFVMMFLLLFGKTSMGAVATQVRTYVDGDVLTASQLNAEYGNLYSTINNLDNANIAAAAAVVPEKIDASIAGDGITRNGSTGVLAVNVDGTTIETNSDAIRVKDGSITAAKIANATITDAKLVPATITGASIANTTIAAANIVNSTITGAKIANATIATANIIDANVTAAKITTNTDFNGKTTRVAGANIVVSNSNDAQGLSILRGAFNGAGAVSLGAGFTISKISTGLYTVNFDTTFGDAPVITATAYNAAPMVCFLGSITATSVIIGVTNLAGVATDSDVMFHVTGMRN